jgi:hypothetical protein
VRSSHTYAHTPSPPTLLSLSAPFLPPPQKAHSADTSPSLSPEAGWAGGALVCFPLFLPRATPKAASLRRLFSCPPGLFCPCRPATVSAVSAEKTSATSSLMGGLLENRQHTPRSYARARVVPRPRLFFYASVSLLSLCLLPSLNKQHIPSKPHTPYAAFCPAKPTYAHPRSRRESIAFFFSSFAPPSLPTLSQTTHPSLAAAAALYCCFSRARARARASKKQQLCKHNTTHIPPTTHPKLHPPHIRKNTRAPASTDRRLRAWIIRPDTYIYI